MAFESFRAYVEVASGLSDLTRARATEAAQGLLSLPASGVATGTKMAVQATALADELLAAAAANRANLTALVRAEVDAAVSRVGLVPVQKLEEAQAEAATLRAEVATLRSVTPKAAAPASPVKKATAPKSPVKRATAPKSPVRKATAAKNPAKKATAAKSPRKAAAPRTAKTTAKATPGRSAVTTRVEPAGE
ncbi:MAG TPA: hypothetical protein VES02_09665 [Dermatophilaceae bacterium]|nr:hypothetical protein [Dermatophilaceae bacterium]